MITGSEKTKQDLLRAAKKEFAEHGLAGARVDRIAESAGVNKERIYGHFGSKDGLFDAVLKKAMVDAAADKPLQPGDTLADYAGRTFDFHHEHPELLRLLLWEALSRPVAAALEDPERQEHYDSKIEAFRATGLSEEDSRRALFLIMALATYSSTLPQAAALILGPDFSDEDLRRTIVDAVARLAAPEAP